MEFCGQIKSRLEKQITCANFLTQIKLNIFVHYTSLIVAASVLSLASSLDSFTMDRSVLNEDTVKLYC